MQTEEELHYESNEQSPNFNLLKQKKAVSPFEVAKDDPGTFTLAMNRQIKKESEPIEQSNSVVVVSEAPLESESKHTSTIINTNRANNRKQDYQFLKNTKVKDRI